jgi:hypothetical protein
MSEDTGVVEARRRFLRDCGKFALVTPPAVALLLSASKRNYAVAASGRTDDRGLGDDIHAGDPDQGKAGGPEHPL